MKNVKLALIIFHLFSERVFLQEGSINCVRSAGLDQRRGLKQLRAASMRRCELWGREREAGKRAASPKCLLCPPLNCQEEDWSAVLFQSTTKLLSLWYHCKPISSANHRTWRSSPALSLHGSPLRPACCLVGLQSRPESPKPRLSPRRGRLPRF